MYSKGNRHNHSLRKNILLKLLYLKNFNLIFCPNSTFIMAMYFLLDLQSNELSLRFLPHKWFGSWLKLLYHTATSFLYSMKEKTRFKNHLLQWFSFRADLLNTGYFTLSILMLTLMCVCETTSKICCVRWHIEVLIKAGRMWEYMKNTPKIRNNFASKIKRHRHIF